MTEPTQNGSGAPDDFDLDRWIDGTCGLIRTAQIFQLGDQFARLDELDRELAVAKKIPKEDRGVDDRPPESVQDEIDRISVRLLETAITVHVQDRTDDHRREVTGKLKDKGIDPDRKGITPERAADFRDTIGYHLLADAIVKVESADGKVSHFPDGFPVEKLLKMKERLGDAALYDAFNAFRRVTMEAPSVAAPLSRRSSTSHGGIT